MAKEWDGPTEESLAAERDGWELASKFQQVGMLGSKPLDWAPDVDVFDDYKTYLRMDRFGETAANRVELEDTARTLAILRIINSPGAVTIDSKHIWGWTMLLPVNSIDREKLDDVLAAQKQPDKFAPEI